MSFSTTFQLIKVAALLAQENLEDFRKLIQILTFLSPLPHVPLSLHYDFKKDAINEFGIKY
jgi:hypothetical protein